MNLGDKILQLRKKNGLSQEQLGEKVDVTRQTISNWELGETTPNPEQLKKMSKAFNVSVDEILDNDSKEFLMNKISNTERLAGIIIKILKVIGFVLMIIKPFIVPIIIIVILLSIACSITDILYIGFNNEDKVDMKKELAYYNTEYKKDEAKNFFESVWEFVEKIFGGGEMTDKTDWPVKRTI